MTNKYAFCLLFAVSVILDLKQAKCEKIIPDIIIYFVNQQIVLV